MRNVSFSPKAMEHVAWWLEHDRKTLSKLYKLLAEIARDPFGGKGKPEPLKGQYAGAWSRRITAEHRLVYRVTDQQIEVVACRFHYGR